ncbi:MAG TPA: hypothetical protein VH724_05415 [Candidatus Angelobacter sp.]|nr:hypothetical protein [Candidatus Angelobacter sp.]
MRHTCVFTALLCMALSGAHPPVLGQAAPAPQKPKTQPSSPAAAQSQPPTDEELMQKTAQATIDWDKKTTPGAKVDVLLIKKDQVDGKPVMQYHVKASGAPKNKFYTLMAWPITLPVPVTMMEGLVIAADGTVGCPPDSTKSCAQRMKGAELKLTYTPGIGEIYRHALVSEDHASALFFSIVPAPMIEHDKACSLEVVRLSPRFELAVIRGKGFAPSEQLAFHTVAYQEIHDSQPTVSAQGEFWAVLSPYIKGRTMGTTQVTVRGKTCAPALAFEWGSE